MSKANINRLSVKKANINREIYDHRLVEKKWQDVWLENATFYPKDMLEEAAGDKTQSGSSTLRDNNTFYNLWMFPYPSAEGLHAGHAFASSGSDIYGRFMRMNGKKVFQPIGYDSFGIHSENFAIKIGEQPEEVVDRTTQYYANQMKSLGHGYDWSRTVTTSDVDYYRWTQWLFVEMFKAGLAYRKSAQVNWCPSCMTVLADEQVMTSKQAGKIPPGYTNIDEVPENVLVCERCGNIIEHRFLEQWFFRITDYAEKLLANLSKIDWPEKIKLAQTNWIGKKTGITITYSVVRRDEKGADNNEDDLETPPSTNYKPLTTISVWTSRPDTNFGATFIVVAPEYARDNLLKIITNDLTESVDNYINTSLKKSKDSRIAEGNEKTGVFTGLYAENPLTGKNMPIWVSDFVLTDVGTGAVVGVPAHDERDFAFARKFGLSIKKVIDFDTETHSVVIKKSVSDAFTKAVEKNNWYWNDYEGWGYGLVIPKGAESKYINLVQKHLNEGNWYVHTDGNLKAVIFKNKHFNILTENNEAREYARKIGVPEQQIDWDNENNYMFCYTGEGEVVNSGFLNGSQSLYAFGKISDFLEDRGWGKRTTNYHLRDWLISRQRYWGPPIPMIYCEACAKEGKSWFTELGKRPSFAKASKGKQEVKGKRFLHEDQTDWEHVGWYPEEELPVELPPLEDYKPDGSGKGPLAKLSEFVKTKCPACGAEASRETDVSDTFLDSSWYFLAYPMQRTREWENDPTTGSGQDLLTDKIIDSWLPVDLYFGGAEHAVLHLMYARFVTMVLNDLHILSFDEPFPRFFAHGLMIKDGAKMSKSRGNVVNPDEYIEKFGADALRLYLMFMGPMDGYPDFRDTGIEGMRRFIDRLWGLFGSTDAGYVFSNEDETQLRTAMHKTVKRVTEDIKGFRYNTAIAALMEYVNELRSKTQNLKQNTQNGGSKKNEKVGDNQRSEKEVWNQGLKTLALLLAPFAPHMTEEVWQTTLGKRPSFANLPAQAGASKGKQEVKGKSVIQNNGFNSIHLHPWPKFDPELIKEETVQIVVQVNGKLRGTLTLNKDEANDHNKVVELAKTDENVGKWLVENKVKKEIFVPGKLVNFVL